MSEDVIRVDDIDAIREEFANARLPGRVKQAASAISTLRQNPWNVVRAAASPRLGGASPPLGRFHHALEVTGIHNDIVADYGRRLDRLIQELILARDLNVEALAAYEEAEEADEANSLFARMKESSDDAAGT